MCYVGQLPPTVPSKVTIVKELGNCIGHVGKLRLGGPRTGVKVVELRVFSHILPSPSSASKGFRSVKMGSKAKGISHRLAVTIHVSVVVCL